MAGTQWQFGTLSCLLCGEVVATISGGAVRVRPGVGLARSLRDLRCPRCKGPLYMERALSQADLPVAADTGLVRR